MILSILTDVTYPKKSKIFARRRQASEVDDHQSNHCKSDSAASGEGGELKRENKGIEGNIGGMEAGEIFQEDSAVVWEHDMVSVCV